MGRLAGKVAIVTGGGQGVGLGIAAAFARAGAALVLSGRNAGKLEAAAAPLVAAGAKVRCIAADAGKRADADRVVAAAVAEFGRLDVLVNNAQSMVHGIALVDLTDDQMEMTLQSGLMGTIYHMQAAYPHLAKQGGSIINLGSREGIHGGAGFAIYAAAKEAVRGLSRAAAREMGAAGVRVNVICPAALSPAAKSFLDANPAQASAYLKSIALGYFGDPEAEIGPVAIFLASDDSHYVTGQTINADGGQEML